MQKLTRTWRQALMSLTGKIITALMLGSFVGSATAQSGKDLSDCEQVANPALKVAACTRTLAAKNLTTEQRAFGYYHRGLGLLLQGKFDDAIVEFNEALRADPTNPRYYNSRGNAWRAKGEFDIAIADYNEAIRRDPSFAFAYNGRGSAFYNKGELDRAIADYSEVIRLDPTLAAPYNNRALVWRDKGDFDQALADANEALRRDPTNAQVYSARGQIWRFKGDLDRALADENEAVRLDSQSPLPFVTRGDTYRYRADFARAFADYDQALRLSSEYIPAIVGRGLTFEKQGDFAHARGEYQKALDSRSQFRGDNALSALETARARLAAIASGAPQPIIPAAPFRVVSPDTIPTPVLNVPAPTTTAAPHGRRVALVIGNADYKNANVLMNPQHDAEAIANSLRAIGFESVTLVDDASREKMTSALRAFASEAATADWAVVYYSGHGMEVFGTNFLIPIDAKLAIDRDVFSETVSLDQVMASLNGARRLKLVLLDACRNNPFLKQLRRTSSLDVGLTSASSALSTPVAHSVDRGLAAITVPTGTLVVYAAKHGETALDGQGSNSPFAIAIVQRIATPNVEIDKVFRLVRDDVLEATAGRQEPYTYGSLPGSEDFFFIEKQQ